MRHLLNQTSGFTEMVDNGFWLSQDGLEATVSHLNGLIVLTSDYRYLVPGKVGWTHGPAFFIQVHNARFKARDQKSRLFRVTFMGFDGVEDPTGTVF